MRAFKHARIASCVKLGISLSVWVGGLGVPGYAQDINAGQQIRVQNVNKPAPLDDVQADAKALAERHRQARDGSGMLQPIPLARSASAASNPSPNDTGVQNITSAYGENHEAIVSNKFPNLIVTPYAKPQVVGRDGFDATTNGNTVLITVPGDKPVWLSINDSASPTVAPISLTLMPRAVRSQTVVVQTAREFAQTGADEAGQTSYADTLVNFLRDIARQRVPSGFNVRPLTSPLALDGGIKATPIERYSGARGDIYRWRLTNEARVVQTLSEEAFGADDKVLAVAFYPFISLQPGQSTDVLVMTGKGGK